MVSATTIARSGYYILKILPSLLWLPINIRWNIGHMTDVFEDELIQSGLDHDVSRQLARAYHDANKQLVSQMTSMRSWTR
jgi:hypothetical protein